MKLRAVRVFILSPPQVLYHKQTPCASDSRKSDKNCNSPTVFFHIKQKISLTTKILKFAKKSLANYLTNCSFFNIII